MFTLLFSRFRYKFIVFQTAPFRRIIWPYRMEINSLNWILRRRSRRRRCCHRRLPYLTNSAGTKPRAFGLAAVVVFVLLQYYPVEAARTGALDEPPGIVAANDIITLVSEEPTATLTPVGNKSGRR